MPQQPNPLLARIVPFIAIGVFIVLFILGLVVFSYLLVIGAIVGLVLFAIAYVRNWFLRRKHLHQNPQNKPEEKPSGRTIEHED